MKHVTLPTTEDALKVISKTGGNIHYEENHTILSVNEMCVTLWLGEMNKRKWYIGYCVSIDKENKEFNIEHLHRDKKGSDLKWLYPDMADVCKVESAQILKCGIVGEWDVLHRNMKYTLLNHEQIENQVSML